MRHELARARGGAVIARVDAGIVHCLFNRETERAPDGCEFPELWRRRVSRRNDYFPRLLVRPLMSRISRATSEKDPDRD